MPHNRRRLLELGAAAAAAGLLRSFGAGAAPQGRPAGGKGPIKAIAFDGFPVIDPRPVARLSEEIFPGKGADLVSAWRDRQFEYTWLRTLSNRYVDFWHVTEDALTFAARSRGLDVPPEARVRLMNAYLKLGVWPEAATELRSLKKAGIRMAFLSNFTARIGFGYSDFPAFIANPLLELAGAKSGSNDARLDQLNAFDLDLRVFPFRGRFFVGSSFGRQSLKGAVTENTVLGPQTATVDLTTWYATPRVGWLWTFEPGFLLGLDLGVQFKLSTDRTVTVPPGATPDIRNRVDNLADLGASYPLPSLRLRVGWML